MNKEFWWINQFKILQLEPRDEDEWIIRRTFGCDSRTS